MQNIKPTASYKMSSQTKTLLSGIKDRKIRREWTRAFVQAELACDAAKKSRPKSTNRRGESEED
jgi:hypothetical protein